VAAITAATLFLYEGVIENVCQCWLFILNQDIPSHLVPCDARWLIFYIFPQIYFPLN
jgi:hypothetical protein